MSREYVENVYRTANISNTESGMFSVSISVSGIEYPGLCMFLARDIVMDSMSDDRTDRIFHALTAELPDGGKMTFALDMVVYPDGAFVLDKVMQDGHAKTEHFVSRRE